MSDSVRRATVQDLADYFARLVQAGKGQHTPRLDLRGLCFWRHDQHQQVNLVIPPAGQECDEKKNVVFLSPRF